MKLSFGRLDIQDDNIRGHISSILKEIVNWSQGKIDLRDNCRTAYVEVVTHVTPNTEFNVTHNLGRIPFMYIANIDANGVIYDSSRASWTSSIIKLKCSVGSANARILVLG